MRPADEDQSGSRRPNLMSSTRRSANEINILAMLDRHESAGLPRRMLRGLRTMPAMFWYGAAGVLVAGLAGTVGWLAWDSVAPSPADTALAGAAGTGGKPASAIATAPPAPAAVSPTVPAAASPSPESAPAGGATIVDVAPAPVAGPAADTAAPPQTASMPVRAPSPQQHAGRIVPRDARRDPPRLAAHTDAPKAAPRTAAARAPAHAETRSRRKATSAKPEQDAVDTDVALISAIIQHANKRQEAEDAASKP